MRRKFGKKNIILFIIFIIIVLLITFILGFGVYRVMSYDKTLYTINPDSFMYDVSGNYVMLDTSASLYQRWDKNYYLEKNDNSIIKLGNNVIVYNKNDYKLYLYGSAYKVDLTGDITFLSGESAIIRNGSPSIYKLNDRKYLIVGKSIKSSDNSISTSGYLLIEINKNGTAALSNNEVNIKTLSNLVLVTSDFKLDVANESLIVDEKNTLDLKKILGSTNQYSNKVTSISDKKDDQKKDDTTNKSNDNKPVVGTNSGSNIINNNTNNNNNTTNNNNNLVINNNAPIVKATKAAKIESFSSNPTTISFKYSISDPYDEYLSVFLKINPGTESQKTIILNKTNTNYYLSDLTPNTKYNVQFGYSYVGDDHEISEEVIDTFVIKTASINTNLNISKITNKGVFFNLKYDQGYAFNKASLVLYKDGVKMKNMIVDTSLALSSQGFNSNFDISDLGNEIMIKLEDCYYNDVEVACNKDAKYIID